MNCLLFTLVVIQTGRNAVFNFMEKHGRKHLNKYKTICDANEMCGS